MSVEQVKQSVEQEVARPEGEDVPERAGNKYQYADVISNGEHILDVYVVGDELRIVYQIAADMDLSWVKQFLDKKHYKHERTDLVYQGVQQDTFVDQL